MPYLVLPLMVLFFQSSVTPPILFEPNVGQTDPRVQFIAKTGSYTLFIAGPELVFVPDGGGPIRVAFANGNPEATAEGIDRQPGLVNYFIGGDEPGWRSNVPRYGRVLLHEIYPGVDALFYTRDGQLEYDFVLNAEADPGQIRMRVEGASSMGLNDEGDLVLKNVSGELVHHRPLVYQVIDGKNKPVQSEYLLNAQNEISFKLGRVREDVALVIDPLISYSSYLVGTKTEAAGDGSIYVRDTTRSVDFPRKR